MKCVQLLCGVTCCGAAILMVRPVSAQTSGPVLPQQIDRSVIRPGARSLGLGGTILFGSGASSAAYNPASIANNQGIGSGLEVVARSENIDAKDVRDVIDGVKDLNDAVDDEDFSEDAFDNLFDIARGKNGRPLRVTATPSVGISLGNVGQKRFSAGILAFGEAIADVRINAQGTGNNRTLTTGGGLLGLSSVAVPLAFKFDQKGTDYGTFGINLKLMRADYLAANFFADEANQKVTGTTYDRADDSNFGLDIGYISPNLIKDKPYDLQAAVAVRNLLSPKFDLLVTGQNSDGNSGGGEDGGNPDDFGAAAVSPAVPLNASFKQQPQIDLGLRAGSAEYRANAYAEVHNLTGKNGGDTTFHIGAEYALMKSVALRGGYDDNKFVVGLGLKLAGARLDLAVSQKPQERFAIGFSYGR